MNATLKRFKGNAEFLERLRREAAVGEESYPLGQRFISTIQVISSLGDGGEFRLVHSVVVL